MADQISDSEIVGLFRELRAMDAQLIQGNAQVNAAYEEWQRLSDAHRDLGSRRNQLVCKVLDAGEHAPTIFNSSLAPEKKPVKRAPFTPHEHDIWKRAYALAFESENGNTSVHRAGSSRASRAALAADEAVRLYGESSNGKLKHDD